MTQRQKNIILVVCLILVAIIAYFFSVKNTIEVSKQLAVLKKQKQLYQSAPQQLALLSNKEKTLDLVLKENNLTGLSLQNNLLEVLNKESILKDYTFKIKSFSEPHQYTNKVTKSTVSTYRFELSGSYNALLNIVHKLEQQYSFGNVIHLDFYTEKNYRNGSKLLIGSIFLQRIH